ATLPGQSADEALLDLEQCRSLRMLILTYTVAYGSFDGPTGADFNGDVFWYTNAKEDRRKHFFIGNSFVKAGSEDARWDRYRLSLQSVDLQISEKLDDRYASYLASFAAKR